MELGTGHTPNVHFVIVFKEWHNLDPPHTDLWRGEGGGEGGTRGSGITKHKSSNRIELNNKMKHSP